MGDALLFEGVGSTAAAIFSSAEASPSGLRVSSAPDASARYSRCRDTANDTIWAMIGASRIETIQRMTKRIPSPPDFSDGARRPQRRPRRLQSASEDRTGQRRDHRHQAHVVVLDVRELVRDDPLQLVAVELLEQAPGHGDRGPLRADPRGEGVRIGIRDHEDRGLGHPRRDRHLDDVLEDAVPRIGAGAVERGSARRLENRAVASCERPPGREAAEAERAERGDRKPGREAARIEHAVGGESHEREQAHEARDEHPGVRDVPLLLVVEVEGHSVSRAAYGDGRRLRSTFGTARSDASWISKSSTGWNLKVRAM